MGLRFPRSEMDHNLEYGLSLRPQSPQILVLPKRDKPQLQHLAIGVTIVALISYLSVHLFQSLLCEALVQVLSVGQIPVIKVWTPEGLVLSMRSLVGTNTQIALSPQYSGLLSIVIFSLLFVFLTFPLKGPLWCKILWLSLGNGVGLVWSLLRISIGALVAYHFGCKALAVASFLTGPVVDFLWIVPVWSLGLSFLISAERKKGEVN